MKHLKLSIKPKREPSEGQLLNSSGYSIKMFPSPLEVDRFISPYLVL